MAKVYQKWSDLKAKHLSPERQAKIALQVEQELLEMDLRAIRDLLGKKQKEMEEVLSMSQSEISRFERRQDHRVSRLRQYVEALGGKLEMFATFGDKKIRLRSAE